MSIVDVAVAVLVRADGAVLLAQRPEGKVYAGYWEFPGGKVEPGESVRAALERELVEELGVRPERAYPWVTQTFAYPHASVRLHFFRVTAWHGEPHGRENQRFAWSGPGGFDLEPMLPANAPLLRALAIPFEYGISNAAAVGSRAFLDALERRLAAGLRLVQIRDKSLAPGDRERIARDALARVRAVAGARLLVNADEALARRIGADGVHYTAGQLAVLEERPDFALCAGSAHDAAELARAAALGLDFAVLGPVKATPSHPGAATLGWEAFGALAADCPIPVFALGGITRADLETAWLHGAHGIAMVRGAWAASG
ncbi:MAG: Nudix family hydrolase [Burkholderiales bacterium]|nr:Nudix family hydrolase [Burkholderiales bacterium]